MPANPSILLLQGPNLSYLGKRQPELYGTTSAAELDVIVTRHAEARGARLTIHYTHSEAEAIGIIYRAVEAGTHGLLMNPAGFTQGGFALRDCLLAVPIPYIELHMTNIEKRGVHSVMAVAAAGVIAGFGVTSYTLGVDAMLERLR
jgi:3-dehydroquinate dehydratase II